MTAANFTTYSTDTRCAHCGVTRPWALSSSSTADFYATWTTSATATTRYRPTVVRDPWVNVGGRMFCSDYCAVERNAYEAERALMFEFTHDDDGDATGNQ